MRQDPVVVWVVVIQSMFVQSAKKGLLVFAYFNWGGGGGGRGGRGYGLFKGGCLIEEQWYS